MIIHYTSFANVPKTANLDPHSEQNFGAEVTTVLLTVFWVAGGLSFAAGFFSPETGKDCALTLIFSTSPGDLSSRALFWTSCTLSMLACSSVLRCRFSALRSAMTRTCHLWVFVICMCAYVCAGVHTRVRLKKKKFSGVWMAKTLRCIGKDKVRVARGGTHNGGGVYTQTERQQTGR